MFIKLKQIFIELFTLLMLSIFIWTSTVNAATCNFLNALQSNVMGSTINFTCGSQVQNDPTNAFAASFVTPASCSPATCTTVNCTKNPQSTFVNPLNPGTFQTATCTGTSAQCNIAVASNVTVGTGSFPGNAFTSITVNGDTAVLNFTPNGSNANGSTYFIGSLNLDKATNVIMQPGDYWIGAITTNGGGGSRTITIDPSTTGTVRLFINSWSTQRNITMNAGGTADRLLVYSYDDINVVVPDSVVNGLVYSQKSVTLNGTFTGAVVGTNINLQSATVIYNSAIANLNYGPAFTTCSSPVLNSINVSAGATTANGCQAVTYTVTMQDLNGNPVTNYTGAISINTQTGFGTWTKVSGNGSFTNSGSGVAQYTFANTDNSVASFSLVYPANGPTPMTVRVSTIATPTVSGLAQPVSYIPSQLLVTATAVGAPPPPAAYGSTIKSGNNSTIYLTAYSGSSCGVTTSYTGSKPIRFYTNYINPTTGTKNLLINGIAVATSAGAAATSQNITFTNGQATVTAVYPDVGMLTLFVDDTSTNGPNGQSGNFVVMPDHFAMNVSPTNSATNDTSGTAVASCLADSKFIGAGQTFTVNVQPQNLQNVVTPNYGNETTAQTISLTGPVIAPTSGAGTLNATTMTKVASGGTNPFSAYPFFKASPNFSDVGCINLTASANNYIVAGATMSNSVVVGRFVPDHFAIQTASNIQPILHTVNTSFTYMDQPFTFATAPQLVIQAQNAQNAVTQNYTGQFAKLFLSGLTYKYAAGSTPITAGDVIPALTLTPSASIVSALPSIANGTGTYTFTDGGSGFKIARQAGVLVPPFYAEMQLQVPTIVDSDTVQCDSSCSCIAGVSGCSASPNTNRGFSFGNTTSGNGMSFDGTGSGATKGKTFYFGRMIVVDTIGSELSSLSVPFQIQYYTSSGFVLNTNDSVTVSSTFASPNTPQTCPASGSPNPLLCGSGITTSIIAPFPSTFAAGQANITLSASNALGFVDIIPQLQSAGGANLPWLQFSWPADSSNPTGAFTDNPRGRATFGISKGNDRIIYQKEQFQ